jgi:hypothetical protein
MSHDYLFITPSNYTIEIFLKRLPCDFIFDGQYCINYGIYHAYFEEWDPFADGYTTLEVLYEDQERRKLILQIPDRKFFSLTSYTPAILDIFTEHLCDDHDILIDIGMLNSNIPPIWALPVRGNEYVRTLREKKNKFTQY